MTPTVIVDVCGTLYDENTTAGFVRFVAGADGLRRPWRFWLLEKLRLSAARKIVIGFGRIMGFDLFRMGYISCLAGAKRPDLEAHAAAYAESLHVEKTIAVVHNRLAQFETDGWQPILVSNSLDVVIAAIAARKGYGWLASALCWRGDVCAGRLARDLKGKKMQAFEEAFGPCQTERLAVMTDNRSDADVIDAASCVVLVVKGPQKSWIKKYVSEQLHY